MIMDMKLQVEWAPKGESPTPAELLKYFVEALQAFGWEVVWAEETGTSKREVFRPARAAELMEWFGSLRAGWETSARETDELLNLFMQPEPGPGAGLYALSALPVAGVVNGQARRRLYAGGVIPDCTLDTARKILRKLVHLSGARLATVGPTRYHDRLAASLLYLDAEGRRWFAHNAPNVKLAGDETGGAWVLAHGEALTSQSEHARAANAALTKTLWDWYEATSRPKPQGEDKTLGAAPPAGGPEVLSHPSPRPAPPSLGAQASVDLDRTFPPTPFLGPALPFIARVGQASLPPTPLASGDQSGETVALGELPLLIQGFSLPRYARLRAALSQNGEEHGPTLASFGLDVNSKRSLQQAFFEVFQAQPQLLPTFSQLVEVAKLRQG
jgi:hypothetical protein